MLSGYIQTGGPVMVLVLAAWVVVLACVLDRLLYLLGAWGRHPFREIRARVATGDAPGARRCFARESRRATRGLSRIDAVSQIATSIGLFGTVLGLARTFVARGGDLATSAPEALASGLSTALFTTVGGLVVFLFGQGFLIAWNEWQESRERLVNRLLEEQQS